MTSFSWKLVETRKTSAEAIMAKDLSLLRELNEESKPILHLYEWERPSLTYGYFINPSHHLHLDALKENGIEMARRPTGGGIIFHLTDFAFSILIPSVHPRFSLNTLENYACINAQVGEVIHTFSSNGLQTNFFSGECEGRIQNCSAFCMAKPTCFDLLHQGKKIGGAAQRRIKQGLLHQGSISLAPLSKKILQEVLKSNLVLESMESQSGFLLENLPIGINFLEDARSHLRELMKQRMALFFS